ncbi:hypothetical protein DAEQUDRAFT_729291 [Daedalea quercina L-15889]|uniref:PH domain-containing protein n=1 Tax=Daedalea quercina L-15889 TaxID=1314783 RepID=A0A165NQU2_9APHY|nr:hypothetical protein DAEQUDRAFT_729291 [Daedalea quercina L-15889]
MPRKRSSLQSLFSPASAFVSAPLPDCPSTPSSSRSSSRARSNSAATTGTQDWSSSHFSSISSLPDLPLLDLPATPPRSRDSPPPDLLDDDPFANLSPAPSVRRRRPPSLVFTGIDAPPIADDARSLPPRSPLAIDATDDASSSTPSVASLPDVFSASPSTPSKLRSRFRILRPKSSSNGPAYTRPAFAPRPSLPSLSTLTRSHVPSPKVHKGRVGAQLPAEPWNDSEGDPSSPKSPSTSSEGRKRNRHLRRPTALCAIRDSRMITDGQPWYVRDGSPVHGSVVLVNDNISDTQSIHSSADEDLLVPPLLRTHTDPFPRHLDSPPSSIPSLCPSSPTSSFSSADHSIQLDTPHAGTFPVSHTRHTRYLTSELVQSLEYDYADALSQLSGPPSPEANILDYLSSASAEAADFFKPGTSADTVRTLSIEASALPVSDELPLSPTSTTSEFSTETSTSSSGHSRSSSRSDSTDYGEELPSEHPRQRLRVSAFGIPWPSFGRSNHTPPLSCYTEYTLFNTDPSTAATADDITERASQQHSPRSSYYCNDSDAEYSEPVDGEDGMHRGASYGGSGSSSYNGYYNTRSNGSAGGGGYGGSSGSFGGHGGAGGGRRGDGDGYRRSPGAPITSSESESSEEEEESSDDDDYRTARTARTATSRGSSGSQDDDVPLAQQIPSALKAQSTIRRQVRNEMSQRRRERQQTIRRERDETIRDEHRTLRAQSPNTMQEALARTASAKARAAAAAAAESSSGRTLSGTTRGLSQAAQDPSRPNGRPRTKTLPGNVGSPISIGDLTKKLLGVQTGGVLPAVISKSRRPSVERAPAGKTRSREASITRASGAERSVSLQRQPTRSSKVDHDDGRGRPLRPMRSFHRPGAVPPADAARGPPLPVIGSPVLNAFSNKPQEVLPPVSVAPFVPLLPEEHRALERAKSSRQVSRRPSIEPDRPRMPSLERDVSGTSRGRKPSVNGPGAPTLPPPSTTKVSAQAKPQQIWQQRIYVGTMQQYVVVEVGSATSAGEVLQLVDAQGALAGGAGEGGYMLWEVAQDFGMERPIRSFEMLADICNAWNSDKILLNFLVIKRTLLTSLLSRSNLPRSSPLHSGFVQYEYKRGKWQKRWMELREHSLWLSKREGGKDSVCLCSLNNFDAFYMIRPYKGASTKGYSWAVKSTDSLTFFENTADYVHVFHSNSELEGKAWIEKILLARSYVLYQERNVISTSAGAALARTTTRAGQRPAQPLVSVGASKAEMPIAVPLGFEPGSLLAKRLPA